MACDFDDLVYLARVRYNIILSASENEEAVSEWNRLKDRAAKIANINLDVIFERLAINNFKLKRFLMRIREAFAAGNIEEVDRIIINREVELKGPGRAKLNRVGEFDKNAWVGGKHLDFRFSDAVRIINDIYEGEAVVNAED